MCCARNVSGKSTRTSVFLDTNALVAGVWPTAGGARTTPKLAEAGAIRLLANSHVLEEIEGALRRRAPARLGLLALFLDRSRAEGRASPDARGAGEEPETHRPLG